MPENNLQGEFILTPTPDEKNTDVKTSQPADLSISEAISPGKTPNFYSSFCYYPKNFRFQDQEQDEKIILLVRQHFITNLPWIISIFLLGFIPPIIFLIAPFFIVIPISANLLFFINLFYYLVLFSFLIMNYTIWYFNVGIITNKRLIDIDVHNILVRVLSEARLAAIQDITITQVGGIRSIFNYGNVDIQTEGMKQNLEFYRIPKPNIVRTIIGNLVLNKR